MAESESAGLEARATAGTDTPTSAGSDAPGFAAPRPRLHWSRIGVLALLGFSSGLPNMVVLSLLSLWLADAKVDTERVAMLSWASLPYALKFIWSPLADGTRFYAFAGLGRRRSWLLAVQIPIVALLVSFNSFVPMSAETPLNGLIALAIVLAIASATQDIVADAYRADISDPNERAAAASVFICGYRVAYVSSALVSLIAAKYGWAWAFRGAGLLACVGIITTLLAPEPAQRAAPPRLRDALPAALADFRQRWGAQTLAIAIFIFLFRLPDNFSLPMVNSFLSTHMNYTLDEMSIRNMLGASMMIAGTMVGAVIVMRLGLWRSLFILGILQAVSVAGFAALGTMSPRPAGAVVADVWSAAWWSDARSWALIGSVSAEYLAAGAVSSGFVAFLMSCCDRRFSATQYALLSAIYAASVTTAGALSGRLIAAPSKPGVEPSWLQSHVAFSWPQFFLFCILAGVPGLAMIPLVRRAARSSP